MKKKSTPPISIEDPFAAREAEKYENPIASRELILKYLTERGKPANFDEIAAAMNLNDENQLEALRRRLRAMCRDGQLNLNRKDGYGLIDKMNLVTGRVSGHRDGFGFIIPDDLSSDLLLNARQMRRVFDGDRVLARIVGLDYKKRREASIVEVLEHNTKTIVGRYYVEGGVAYITPENKRITQNILVTHDPRIQPNPGQIVEVCVTTQPGESGQAAGFISEILGDHLAPGLEIDIALRAHQIPYKWPEEVLTALKNHPIEVSETDKKNRVDLRSLPLVTIDGEDAQDFDDAVFAEKQGKNYRLIVAIADVSHYVTLDSPLDQEALHRATSVYFPGQVIPMLPEILSNELCSLKPHVDRLCMACELIISPRGKILQKSIFPAVMHSHARLTYCQVQDLLDGNLEEQKKIPILWSMLKELYALYEILLSAREKRGALDFSTVETQIVFGAQRKIEKIIPRTRLTAHRIIEECMLAANVAVAEFLAEQKDLPILYRVHNGPKPDKLSNLRQFLAELGLTLGGKTNPSPKDYAQLLDTVSERPDAHLIQTMLLRSLSQAIYSPENSGHFGLSYKIYTHFTSPIRRYPDLLIHRAITHLIDNNSVEEFTYSDEDMNRLGKHCSSTERRADEATREVVSWLKCEYMQDKLGQIFQGTISAVTGFGIFVELDEIYVEGLVHVTSLRNDYYAFDAVKHRLIGERSGQVYRLGDKMTVLVARVDLDERKIDFEPAETEAVDD